MRAAKQRQCLKECPPTLSKFMAVPTVKGSIIPIDKVDGSRKLLAAHPVPSGNGSPDHTLSCKGGGRVEPNHQAAITIGPRHKNSTTLFRTQYPLFDKIR